jgi:hypothetical protein
MLGHRRPQKIDARGISGGNEGLLFVDPTTDERHPVEVQNVTVGRRAHRRRLRGRDDEVVRRPRPDVDVQVTVARRKCEAGDSAVHLDQVVDAGNFKELTE